MALMLGIDTGGTYTDAVLVDDALDVPDAVVASAKALTTRDDLSVGISGAVDAVLAERESAAADIALVSLSTTLATNAVVEGQGGRVGLVLIGFSERATERDDLRSALGDGPLLLIAGGHTAHGAAQSDVDLDSVRRWLDTEAGAVDGFAVAGEFAVRNPEHECAVRDVLRDASKRPVTCSHELSSKLDGPRRAVTSVLNARLIGLIDDLIDRSERLLGERQIAAPVMVVRGDGALVSADVARRSPVETILSGPAASLVGAAFLHRSDHAVVSDIGGTTTDVALLVDGFPRLDPAGASVGGWRTMVEAVAMWTVGLGGDSEVHLVPEGLDAAVRLGPRRAIPLSLLAARHGTRVTDALQRQLRKDRIDERDGQFVVQVRTPSDGGKPLRDVERGLLERLGDGPVALDELITVRMQLGALDKLVARGLVMMSTLTPSDAAHVLGRYDAWHGQAAHAGAEIYARRRNARGLAVAADADAMARMVLDALTRRSVETVLEAALAEDGFDAEAVMAAPVFEAAVAGHRRTVALSASLAVPLIGLGASAATYYPDVGVRLGVPTHIPEHADVANAVGAVVGQVQVQATASISQPEAGRYRVHYPTSIETYATLEEAEAEASERLAVFVSKGAQEAGAEEFTIAADRALTTVDTGGQTIFVECVLTATATGRPRRVQAHT